MRTAIVIALLGAAAPAAAQPAVVGEPAPAASAGLIVDGALGAQLGGAYTRRDALVAFGDLTWIAGDADLDDLRVRGGVELDAWRPRAVGLRLRVAAFGARAANPGFTATGFGCELGALAGRFGARWSAAAELRWTATLATHLAHTAWYRANVYPDVRDGWYRVTASTPRAGVRGGLRAGAYAVTVSAGWAWLGALDLLPAPYAELHVARTW